MLPKATSRHCQGHHHPITGSALQCIVYNACLPPSRSTFSPPLHKAVMQISTSTDHTRHQESVKYEARIQRSSAGIGQDAFRQHGIDHKQKGCSKVLGFLTTTCNSPHRRGRGCKTTAYDGASVYSTMALLLVSKLNDPKKIQRHLMSHLQMFNASQHPFQGKGKCRLHLAAGRSKRQGQQP